MNDVAANIRKIREQRRYSQGHMATQLGMTQASYSRIESGFVNLKVDQLQEIADILETDIAALLDSSKITIQNQTNNDGAYGNGYVENLHIENKETVNKLVQNFEKLVQTLEDENRHLIKEVEFLRSLIKPENFSSLAKLS